ncbi:response regulator transcription factor [Microbacterium sp. ET2]|uniref:response regulator n=1 Tax=Microbacterium albipurpureum TaxID=3050384 RepID=UPI00259CE968|nr:response regulator transcription factor [Microbacterium sp. ET2 (Ac-2212)]WJL96529.1 response regulator transcription factor [Microbacterium sp. ET2 (Ac-2212)]
MRETSFAAVRSPRIMVADDHALVRSGIIALLEAAELEVVGEAGTGEEAVAVAQRIEPDVVLMDIRMPGMDGIEATAALTETPDPPRVLVLTTFDLDEYVYRALQAGASGFLLKDAPPDRLVDAVRTVATGEALLAPTVTRRLIERYLSSPAQPVPGPTDLTPRETEIWLLIARGLSNMEIGRELFLSEATVKAHVTRLLAKLGVRDRVQAVVVAYETGTVRAGGKS